LRWTRRTLHTQLRQIRSSLGTRHSESPNSWVIMRTNPKELRETRLLGDKNRQQKGYCSKVVELWVPKKRKRKSGAENQEEKHGLKGKSLQSPCVAFQSVWVMGSGGVNGMKNPRAEETLPDETTNYKMSRGDCTMMLCTCESIKFQCSETS